VRSRRTSKIRTEAPEDLSRQLLNAQEEERRRISRELHDETGQGLMVLRFQLEMLASDAKSHEGKAKIQESLELLDRTIEGLRRTIARLSPRVLEELGLLAGLRREAQLVSRHTGIAGNLQLPEEIQPLSREQEVAIYRSVQEALHNIAKHSHARRFSVKLDVAASKVTVLIEDDGVGFSPRTATDRGFGLEGMRERAAALGGSVTVRSGQGKGARIRLVFPLESTRNLNPAALENSLQRVSAA
jgi:two-component system sensor histidine kinase UhpB